MVKASLGHLINCMLNITVKYKVKYNGPCEENQILEQTSTSNRRVKYGKMATQWCTHES
jgi:hypothetical protein